MREQTFRILGSAPRLSTQEHREIAREVARLRALLDDLPGRTRVSVRRNPSGVLGEYVGLLLEGTAQGMPLARIVPLSVRLLYGHRRWFAIGLEAIEAFCAQYGGD